MRDSLVLLSYISIVVGRYQGNKNTLSLFLFVVVGRYEGNYIDYRNTTSLPLFHKVWPFGQAGDELPGPEVHLRPDGSQRPVRCGTGRAGKSAGQVRGLSLVTNGHTHTISNPRLAEAVPTRLWGLWIWLQDIPLTQRSIKLQAILILMSIGSLRTGPETSSQFIFFSVSFLCFSLILKDAWVSRRMITGKLLPGK